MNNPFLFAATLCTAAVMMTACQNSQNDSNGEDAQAISKKAIEVHDEIMPQISKFDKTSVKIDSMLNQLSVIQNTDESVDTAAVRSELTTLKAEIEAATDHMMDWMRNYSVDSADASYQKEELERIKVMKKEFDAVDSKIESKMNAYAK